MADQRIAEIRRMLERHMPRTIKKAGTVRDVYLLVGGDENFRTPKPSRERRAKLKRPSKNVVVTSAYLQRRFGIRA